MTEKPVNTIIEILGKPFTIKTSESALPSLQHAAQYLNSQMTQFHGSGKLINLEIAIITALNIAHQFLELDQQKTRIVDKINQRLTELQEKLENRLAPQQNELLYTIEQEACV